MTQNRTVSGIMPSVQIRSFASSSYPKHEILKMYIFEQGLGSMTNGVRVVKKIHDVYLGPHLKVELQRGG